MLVRVLGPVALGPSEAPVATRKTRQVVALLALAAPGSRSAAQLVDALWDDPPASAIRTVQSHVARARAALVAATGSADPITGGPHGYALAVAVEQIDAGLEAAVRHQARDATARGDHRRAASLLARARQLWRGDADLPDTLAGEIERTRLLERRLGLVEDHVASLIELGADADALAELDAAIGEDPYRERLWGLRMLALYRCGRQADALRTYQEVRRLLGEELGLAPGPELRHLEAAILAQAPDLAPAPSAATTALGVGLPRYATVDGRHIAYAVFGEVGRDLLVLTPGFITIDAYLEEPRLAAAIGALTTSWRVLALDRGGLGLSDPVRADEDLTLRHWVDDVVAVLDADRTAAVDVLANGDTALVALLLAATHPDRVRSLTLLDPYARAMTADDYPHGFSPAALDELRRPIRTPGAVGPDHLSIVAPSVAGDDRFRAWWDRVGRRAASPATAHRLFRVITEGDVRAILPLVDAPVVVVVRNGCPSYDPGHARYLVERVVGAELIETDDADDLWWLGDQERLGQALAMASARAGRQ